MVKQLQHSCGGSIDKTIMIFEKAANVFCKHVSSKQVKFGMGSLMSIIPQPGNM